jgi:hypothetical protein
LLAFLLAGLTSAAGAGFGIGFVAGAAGSVAGQIAGNALGVQDGFSWSAVAAGAIGSGLGASGALGGLGGSTAFGKAIAGNLVNQGVGIITGAQKGFSWAGVAASAIAAPITGSISQSIKGSGFAKISPLNAGIAGAVAGITTTTVNELTRVAISGGKASWANVAIGGVQGGIYGYGEGVINQAKQQRVAQGNDNAVYEANQREANKPIYDSIFKGSVRSVGNARDAGVSFTADQFSSQADFDRYNVQNGGLNAGYGDALGNGVVYDKEQYMKGAVKVGAEALNSGNAEQKGDWRFYFDNQSRLNSNSTQTDNNKIGKIDGSLRSGNIASKPDVFGAAMSLGEKLSEASGRVGGALAATKGNAKYLNGEKALAMLTLPYDEAKNVTKITSNSGRLLSNADAFANGFRVLGGLTSAVNVGADTYRAPADKKYETFAGSAVSATYGAVGFEGSVALGASALSWAPPYGPIVGGIIGGGVFIWGYEFNGGSDYVKATYINGLLKLNGKEYLNTR